MGSSTIKTIPNGYKQTEIGVIPDDWNVESLNDLVEFTNGKAHENVISKNGNYLVVNSKFVSTQGEIYKTSNVNLCPLSIGDIAMVMSDIPNGKALAKCFYVDKNNTYTLNQRICGFRSIDSNSRFLFYKLNRNKYFLDFDSGSGQTNLKKSEVLDCQISIPSDTTEQELIATALSDIDELIQKTESLIEKKKAIKQGAMQELLTGKRRLPGFNAEWQDVALEDVVSQFTTGLNPRQNFQLNNGGDIFYVTIKNFSNGKLLLDDKCDMVDREAFIKINNRSDLKKDDLLFVSIGRVGDVYLIPEDPINWNINESVFSLRPNQKRIVPKFLYHILTDEKIRKLLDLGITGSTFKSIKMADLKKIPSVIPKDKQEQTAIATILSDIDTEIEKLESELTKWRDMKQGMMQTLLTGKIRLIK